MRYSFTGSTRTLGRQTRVCRRLLAWIVGATATLTLAAPPGFAAPDQPSAATSGPSCPTARCTTITMTGDMLLHPGLWQQARDDAAAAGQPGYTFVPILEGQRRYLQHSDLAICHQETPVGTPDGPFAGYPSFNVPPQITSAAKAVGYRACTTASNHTIDWGMAGVVRTLDTLAAAGLSHTGSYRSEAESHGILLLSSPTATVAVIAGTYGHNGQIPEFPWEVDELDPARMIDKARRAIAAGADIVIGVMHAGDEYASEPNQQQREVSHALVDSGLFTMVYGHHSHSVLPIEKYRGAWIAYGLGNFQFIMPSPRHDWFEGAVALLRWEGGGGPVLELLPTVVDRRTFTVELAFGRDHSQATNLIQARSQVLASDASLAAHWQQFLQDSAAMYLRTAMPAGASRQRLLSGASARFWRRYARSHPEELAYLLNVARCDSHRVALTGVLEDLMPR